MEPNPREESGQGLGWTLGLCDEGRVQATRPLYVHLTLLWRQVRVASDPRLATRQLQPAGSRGDDRPRERPGGRKGQSRCGRSPLKCRPDGSRSLAEPRWAER